MTKHTAKAKIILALGSNINDRAGYLRNALELLKNYISDIKFSSVYESAAMLPENAPQNWNIPFLNLVLTGKTDLLPLQLLEKNQAIEILLGRDKNHKLWSPREIDIDILSYNNEIINSKNLTIPHSGLINRDFFLIPLAEIEPDWLYPIKGIYYNKSAKQLARELNNCNIVRIDINVT